MAADMSIPFLGKLPLDPRIGVLCDQFGVLCDQFGVLCDLFGQNTHCSIYTSSLSLCTGKCCDEGKSLLSEIPDSPAAKAYTSIIEGKRAIIIFRIVFIFLFSFTLKQTCLCSNSKEVRSSNPKDK